MSTAACLLTSNKMHRRVNFRQIGNNQTALNFTSLYTYSLKNPRAKKPARGCHCQ